LSNDGGGHRLGRSGESCLEAIADSLEVNAPEPIDRRVEQGQVARDPCRHRNPIPLPERGTPFDVGEQEGDGAAGQIAHLAILVLVHGEIQTILACRFQRTMMHSPCS
jgi:hypothetical protein